MKKTIAIVLMIIQVQAFAQNDITFKNAKVIAIDSINNCSSHYAIVFLRDTDTVSSIIQKNDLKQSPSSYVGEILDVETEQPASVLIGVNKSHYRINLLIASFTHTPNGSLSKSSIILRTKKGRKEILSIAVSSYIMNWEGRMVIVKSLHPPIEQ